MISPPLTGDQSLRNKMLILVAGFTLLKLMIHVVTNIWGGYGYFRDELYYLACSRHLDLGYVDQPPLSIYVLAAWRLVAGDSIFSLRLLPALAGSATVFFTGLIAISLGGRTNAVVISCLASVVSLINLGFDTVYSMNAFDVMLWAIASYLVIRLVVTGSQRYWILLGWILGIGLLNKISVFWLGSGIAMGFLLTRERTWLRTRWPYVAAAIALTLFLPFVIWNMMHNWAHLEFIHNASSGKYSGLNAGTFLAGQFLIANPVTAIVWLPGLWFLFAPGAGRRFMVLGVMCITVCVILIANKTSKAEYFAPMYAVLFAAGGAFLDGVLSRVRLRMLHIVPPLLLTSGLLLAPAVLPILPVDQYIRYADALGIEPSTSERNQLSDLPQFYADMFGWEDKARAVSRVYRRLPELERKRCVAYASNYGRCGAIDFFRKTYPLPPVYGSHNNYWLWGPPPDSASTVIILGGRKNTYADAFEDIEAVDSVSTRHVMPYEDHLTIFVCRKLRVPLASLWPSVRHYD
jgi:hypothetical protein